MSRGFQHCSRELFKFLILCEKTLKSRKKLDISKKTLLLQRKTVRDVAQPGSALRSGRRGRKFESCHPDCKNKTAHCWAVFFCNSSTIIKSLLKDLSKWICQVKQEIRYKQRLAKASLCFLIQLIRRIPYFASSAVFNNTSGPRL